ncbi:MAG: hypothetical protein ACYTG0_07125 [Planctomycetota bacterium]
MNLTTTIPSGGKPFEGDRELFLRGIPENARVTSARVTAKPSDAKTHFTITTAISLESEVGTFGATKAYGGRGQTNEWVEVDFHARRTLASVEGSKLLGTTLQVDMGGAFVEINQNGAFLTQGGDAFELTSNKSGLPSLTVSKFRLTLTHANDTPDIEDADETLDIQKVNIRSVPTNLSFRIGQQAPFWTQTGELATESESPDFSDLLQSFLEEADIENGFCVVPLIVHSDTLAKMDIVFQVEFVTEESLLSPGVNETAASFDSGGSPAGAVALPALKYPKKVPIAVSRLSGRIVGAFDESRIAPSPRGIVSDTTPVRLVEDTIVRTLQADRPSPALAQIVEIGGQADGDGATTSSQQASGNGQVTSSAQDAAQRQVAVTAIDVLVAVAESCRLQLDLRRDADGKPSTDSLLPVPIEFAVEPQVAGEPVWASVPLQSELILGGKKGTWLVLQNIALESFDWRAIQTEGNKPQLLRTENGGVSWAAVDKLSALYRVRHEPDHFTMPIELQFGTGESAVSVSLDRFAPLGRVDVSLDFPAALEAINQALGKVAAKPCPEVEHLANGDFEFWIQVGSGPEEPEEWNLVSGGVTRLDATDTEPPFAVLHDEITPSILSQVSPVQGSCRYEFSFIGSASANGAEGQVRWLNENCEIIGDPERLFIEETKPSIEGAVNAVPFHRSRFSAPADAVQAEVRFFSPVEATVKVGAVSLMGTEQPLKNTDLKEFDEDNRPADWSIEPRDAPVTFSLERKSRVVWLAGAAVPSVLAQTFEAPANQRFELRIVGQTNSSTEETELLTAELSWLDSDNKSIGSPIIVDVQPGALKPPKASGTTPAGTLGALNPHNASGTTPAGTLAAKLRLLLPGGITAGIQDISIRFQGEMESLPISIVAQGSGAVTLSDFRAEFEPREIKAPEIPARGLCEPADADSEDDCGKQGSSTELKCPSCGARLMGVEARVTRNNRPARVATCANCGPSLLRFVRFGGPFDPSAPLLSSQPSQPATSPIGELPRTETSMGELAVSNIDGVGEAISETLAAMDPPVRTIADLSSLPGEVVDGIPSSSKLRQKAIDLISVNLDARGFVTMDSVALTDLLETTAAQLSASSGRSKEEAQQFLESLRFIKARINVKNLGKLTLDQKNQIRRRPNS